MKITLDVELQENEQPHAAQVKRVLENFSGRDVDVRITVDKTGLEDRIRKAIVRKCCDDVQHELYSLLTHPSTAEEALETLCSAALFSTLRVEQGQPVDPFVAVVQRLRDGQRQTVRAAVVQRAVEFLSTPRRVDCGRLLLLPFCETIAVFVKVGLLSVLSVARVTGQWVQQTPTRTAGTTLLGKLLEVAHDKVRASDVTTQEALRSAAKAVQRDEFFAYDADYIAEALGMSHSKCLYGLRRSCAHHQSAILALACSGGSGVNHRGAVVTSSADGTIGTWDANGEVTESMRLSRHYAASLDLTARGRVLLAGGVGMRAGTPPAVILYKEQADKDTPSSRWIEVDAVELSGAQFITAVRSFHNSSTDAQYCVAASTHNRENRLQVYSNVQLVQEYTEHSDIITALHRFTDATMLTGSRDRSVKLYDLRSQDTRQIEVRHSNTITSIGSCGDHVFTAGLDKRLAVVDMRMPSQEYSSVELDSAILDISVNASGTCAAATVAGFYTINFPVHRSSRPFQRVYCGANSPRYNATSWSADGNVLYAGGLSASLDIFDRQYSENDS